MNESDTEVLMLWDTYALPPQKRIHSYLVAKVADFFVSHIVAENRFFDVIDRKLLHTAALLHDIDKNIPWEKGETHPDAGVRIIRSLGLDAVAELIAIHPLHRIIEKPSCLVSWEQKILFLADKMTKYEVISVSERFLLWENESLTAQEREVLRKAYPLVKALEQEICTIAHVTEIDVIQYGKEILKGGNLL